MAGMAGMAGILRGFFQIWDNNPRFPGKIYRVDGRPMTARVGKLNAILAKFSLATGVEILLWFSEPVRVAWQPSTNHIRFQTVTEP